MADKNDNHYRRQLGGGSSNATDIRGARRDAERMVSLHGPKRAKSVLQEEYGYSQERSRKMVNTIQGK